MPTQQTPKPDKPAQEVEREPFVTTLRAYGHEITVKIGGGPREVEIWVDGEPWTDLAMRY